MARVRSAMAAGLGAADLAVDGMELAVDVGEADLVEVDQGEVADAGAGEGFDRP